MRRGVDTSELRRIIEREPAAVAPFVCYFIPEQNNEGEYPVYLKFAYGDLGSRGFFGMWSIPAGIVVESFKLPRLGEYVKWAEALREADKTSEREVRRIWRANSELEVGVLVDREAKRLLRTYQSAKLFQLTNQDLLRTIKPFCEKKGIRDRGAYRITRKEVPQIEEIDEDPGPIQCTETAVEVA